MEKKKIEIVLFEKELKTLLNALDFYSRIWIGQYDDILWKLRWYRKYDQLDAEEFAIKNLMLEMRHVLLPGLNCGLNGSYGIFSPKRDFRAGISYDMQQEFRYRLAWFVNPEGGNTVDYGKPLPCEDDPCEWPGITCYDGNESVMARLAVDETQAEIMAEALDVFAEMYDGNIRSVFSHYTDNEEVLEMAGEITRILSGVEKEYDAHTEEMRAVREEIIRQAKKGCRAKN